jgi:hypothetical protein
MNQNNDNFDLMITIWVNANSCTIIVSVYSLHNVYCYWFKNLSNYKPYHNMQIDIFFSIYITYIDYVIKTSNLSLLDIISLANR